jgi:septal ring factor EnvC (AmiA/AmiB activator)
LKKDEKIKQKDQEIALKAAKIDDYKKIESELQLEIAELKKQIKNFEKSQQVESGSETIEDDNTKDRMQKLMLSDPNQAAQELFKLWCATTKEYKILK